MRIAVMQPYFVPYAGYFRLFAASDLFVVYDDVQFPKEGWVNRNRLMNHDGNGAWLTIPLKKAPLVTQIKDVHFADQAQTRWEQALQYFPLLQSEGAMQHPLRQHIALLDGVFVDFVIKGLQLACEDLGLPFNVLRSSEISYDRTLKGSERLLSLLNVLGCTHYINSPGGQALYQQK